MNFPGNPASGSLSSNFERVEIANGSSGALNASFSNFTVALWLNPSNTTRDRFAIGKMGGGGQRGWQIVSPTGTSELVIDYFDMAAGMDRSLHLPNALPLDTWTHVIFAFDGVNQTEAVYLNNVLQNSVDTSLSGSATVLATLNGSNSAAFRVGHRGASGSSVGSWAGGIDDVMVFNETLAHTPAGSLTGTGSTLVPEPTACLTFGLGMAGLTVLRRRAKLRGGNTIVAIQPRA
ncbi:MAG: LamG-like jellyroll fold domain-containing protein [Pirellulales bacterium]